ncbi:putative integrin-like protein [Enhygromyxa salina]|uniref:Putative integrin-like protein n=1 Tax=Enhygromyxa salina TaxID=215803 RepID=A0A0C1ZCE4_9BACT|nr:integrin alpha [Enhygromyxa salina]KIG15359.1 putative integrin-like protein [Enhygromyxa salina]
MQADFNGDGYADLAIGVPGEGLGSSLPSAGAVNVIYGSSDGLDADGNQLWTQDTPGVEGIAEANDNFGTTLAAGDFNDDGYADLAIGVPHEGIGDTYRAGAVNVLYGSPSGLKPLGSQLWSQNISGIADHAEFNDKFGASLTTGDFDDDGYVDLAIGVPYEDINGRVDAGAVHVIYGSSSGLAAANDQFWHQGVPGVTGTLESDDRFGSALAAGDFDDDGKSDLAVGVPLEDISEIVDAGLVHVLYGTNSGLGVTGDQTWHQNSNGIQGVAEAFDEFGAALAVGDFDDDGRDDLAVGVPYDDVDSAQDAGAVNVIFGGANGLDSANDQLLNQAVAGIEGVAESFDQFGMTLASGDFDGDGHGDLAIGVPGEDLSDESTIILDAGAVNVVYGANSGVSTKDNRLFSLDTSGIGGAAAKFDGFGSALTTGDFDGDERVDLAIGVPYEDVEGEADAGAVHVIYGSGSGLKAKGDQVWHQDSPGIEGVADQHDHFGATVR